MPDGPLDQRGWVDAVPVHVDGVDHASAVGLWSEARVWWSASPIRPSERRSRWASGR
jgi:hypothetical protein